MSHSLQPGKTAFEIIWKVLETSSTSVVAFGKALSDGRKRNEATEGNNKSGGKNKALNLPNVRSHVDFSCASQDSVSW